MLNEEALDKAISAFAGQSAAMPGYRDGVREAIEAYLAALPKPEVPTNASLRDGAADALNDKRDFANLPRHVRVSCYDAIAEWAESLLAQRPAPAVAWDVDLAKRFVEQYVTRRAEQDETFGQSAYQAGLAVGLDRLRMHSDARDEHLAKIERENRYLRAKLDHTDSLNDYLRAQLAQAVSERDEARKLVESIRDVNHSNALAYAKEKDALHRDLKEAREEIERLAGKVRDETHHKNAAEIERERAEQRLREVEAEAKLAGWSPADGDVPLPEYIGLLRDYVEALRAQLRAVQSAVYKAGNVNAATFGADDAESLWLEVRKALAATEQPAEAVKPWLRKVLDDAERRTTVGAPWPTRESESAEAPKPAHPEGWTYASPSDALRPNERHALRPVSEAPKPAEPQPELGERVARQDKVLRLLCSYLTTEDCQDLTEACRVLKAGGL